MQNKIYQKHKNKIITVEQAMSPQKLSFNKMKSLITNKTYLRLIKQI